MQYLLINTASSNTQYLHIVKDFYYKPDLKWILYFLYMLRVLAHLFQY